MQTLFGSIYYFFAKRKALLYTVFFGTFLLFSFFAAKVNFVEDVYAILPKDAKTEKLTQVFENSKFADKIAVMVSLKDTQATNPDSLISYVQELGSKMERDLQPYIKKLTYKIEDNTTLDLFQTIQQYLPIFLSKEDYVKIDSLMQPERIKATLENNIRLLSSPSAFAIKNVIAADPSGISFIALKKLQQLQYDENFELYDGHLITKDQKTALLFLTPSFPAGNTGKNAVLFQEIQRAIDSLNTRYINVQTDYFGAALVSQGNAAQLRKDTLLTQGITVLFLVLFIGFYFRKKRAPFLILLPVAYGVAFSLFSIYFIKGSISVIALGTGSIVLGIAVNYSLHVFNHYRHTGDLAKVIKELSFPLTIGSLTSILSFLSLQFATSAMLKDLGLFAGFSLIGASLSSLIFLPHFLGKSNTRVQNTWLDMIATIRFEQRKIVLYIILLLTILFSFFVNKVQFEPDMTQLNYMSPKLKEAEKRLNKISGGSLKSIYVVTDGNNLEQALVKNEKLEKDIMILKASGLISNSSSVSAILLSDSLQKNRIQTWNNYWGIEQQRKVLKNFISIGVPLGYKATAFNDFDSLLSKKFTSLQQQDATFLRATYLDDYITEKPNFAQVVTLLKVADSNKAKVSAALSKNPDATVLDRQYLTNKLTQMVGEDFNKIAWVVSILVFVVLLITYGRIELALISFIPMLISWVWILGIMAMADIKFNIVNIIVSALIFGLGDDYSLFVMDGLLNEYKTGKKNLAHYKSSILISGITTIAGLGVLLFAKHPALRSIAFISVTGIISVLVMSQVLIPFFFSLVIKNRVQRKLFPWTLIKWIHSIIAYGYFAIASVFLTIAGFFLVKLNPFNKEKGKHLYHVFLSKLAHTVIYFMGPFHKKQIINPNNETLKEPAIIIANHQSAIDVLMIAMLNPSIIQLTNKRAWSSDVSGPAIQMADYYPVADGIENSIDLLQTSVDKGYSITVFPEGTRSSNLELKRFHKGAFYLADKLQLDIVPVLLHGTGYTMAKGDLMLKGNKLTARFLPRIVFTDNQWGQTYQERTKKISKYFKEQYQNLRAQIETPRYFKEKLLYNYIYKGPVLEWYLKVKIRLENYYEKFDELLPKEGNLLDIGCGYGFMSYMLHWSSSEKRIMTGIDYDEEKIATANHCFSKTNKLRFIHENINDFSFEKYNGIVISDVLHYLKSDQQMDIINKAIQSLLPNGLLMIRDGDADLKAKHKGTQFTEFMSTKVLSFNKKVNALNYLSGKTIEQIARKHQLKFEILDQTKYTSNVVWIMRKSNEVSSSTTIN